MIQYVTYLVEYQIAKDNIVKPIAELCRQLRQHEKNNIQDQDLKLTVNKGVYDQIKYILKQYCQQNFFLIVTYSLFVQFIHFYLYSFFWYSMYVLCCSSFHNIFCFNQEARFC